MANIKVKTTTGRQTEPRQINLAKSACRFRKFFLGETCGKIEHMNEMFKKQRIKATMIYITNIELMTGGSLTFMGYTLLQILLGF